MEIGTLKELDVKPGDVVEWVEEGGQHTVLSTELTTRGSYQGQMRVDLSDYGYGIFDKEQFLLISRAPRAPKTWGEMTDAEKGALLLAAHEGKVIECIGGGRDLFVSCEPQWKAEWAYRIAARKPHFDNWHLLPKWARFIAQTEDGSVLIYENEPIKHSNAWGLSGGEALAITNWRLGYDPGTGGWENSLIERPEDM